jgi:hypothetical protein
MGQRQTWLSARSFDLRAALLDLGLSITDTDAQSMIAEIIDEYSTLIRVTRHTAQRKFTTNICPRSHNPSRYPSP